MAFSPVDMLLHVASEINKEITIGIPKEAARQILGTGGKEKKESGNTVVKGDIYIICAVERGEDCERCSDDCETQQEYGNELEPVDWVD